jgi:hypothetical protein
MSVNPFESFFIRIDDRCFPRHMLSFAYIYLAPAVLERIMPQAAVLAVRRNCLLDFEMEEKAVVAAPLVSMRFRNARCRFSLRPAFREIRPGGPS